MRLEGKEKLLYLRKANDDELELSDWYHDFAEFAPGVTRLVFTFGELAGIADGLLYDLKSDNIPETVNDVDDVHTYQLNNEPYGWTRSEIIHSLIERIIETKFKLPGMGALNIKALGKEYYVLFAAEAGIYELNNLLFKVKQDRLQSEVENYLESKQREKAEAIDEDVSDEPDPIETVEADIIQTVPEEVKQGTNYSLNAVYTILQKAKSDYEEIIKVGGAPEALAEKRLIIRDALLDYYKELRGRDTAWYINPQPELTIFKNNDQRKEWAENYKAWGEWYYDEHIDCHYYKYDFQNGDRLVVDEYRDREYFWSDKKKDEQHYHLLQMKKPAYGGTKTFEQKYMHQTSSMTEIVEYLKELQKKGA
jgi:hypothetical protein